MKALLYSIPFFIISFVLIIIFEEWLTLLGPFSGFIGIGLGILSLIIGILIESKQR